MALVKQIYDLINDSVDDALGKVSGVTDVDTTDIASLGKTLANMDLLEDFYGALANRIVKTVYFVRTYKNKTRSVLRDEHEYGAFVQKVYYVMPDAVENPTFDVPQGTTPETYAQQSPYDVENVVAVSAKIYGGQGTWSIEIIRPEEQIKSAFLNEGAMMSFIDGIYLTVENAFKLEEDRLIATAVNTSIANSINGSKARNLLKEYNTNHSTATLTKAQALESAEFLKFASKEIGETIDHMSNMSTVFNVNGYATFTDKEHLVVEMLEHFAIATDMYLQADTFHNELTKLPNYEKVSFWQSSGKSFGFDDCSKIDIVHDDFKTVANPTGEISQDGIICFIHDDENVAAYFGNRKTWEVYNPRSEVYVHGEKARKGFAIDSNANSFVFYIAEEQPAP